LEKSDIRGGLSRVFTKGWKARGEEAERALGCLDETIEKTPLPFPGEEKAIKDEKEKWGDCPEKGKRSILFWEKKGRLLKGEHKSALFEEEGDRRKEEINCITTCAPVEKSEISPGGRKERLNSGESNPSQREPLTA